MMPIFTECPFFEHLYMNNKTYQIKNLKLIIHYELDYENTYVIIFNKSTPTFRNGLFKCKNMDWSIDWNDRK
jgi:hypothetical protein